MRGLAAGQSAVCYVGDRVTVQATIDEVLEVTGVTVLGPWPGHKVLKAQDVAFTELADVPSGVTGMPPMVHMPKRGPYAESTARTAALLEGMPVELGTHGWKLADRPGPDLERSAALLREDLDALAVLGHAWAGPLVVTARGPWSLAATLWLARGDRVLSDHGAVRELVESLAEGLALLVARVRQAAPYAEIVLVLREPHLPDVLGGAVSTFSGHGRIVPSPSADASAALDRVIGRRATPAPPGSWRTAGRDSRRARWRRCSPPVPTASGSRPPVCAPSSGSHSPRRSSAARAVVRAPARAPPQGRSRHRQGRPAHPPALDRSRAAGRGSGRRRRAHRHQRCR